MILILLLTNLVMGRVDTPTLEVKPLQQVQSQVDVKYLQPTVDIRVLQGN